MNIGPQLGFSLTILSGLCWTLVYILIIYRSVRDKTYGMPFWALAFNISWEFIFSTVFISNDATQIIVNRIWFGFDAFILIAYFVYGRKDWPAHISKAFFYPYSLLVLTMSFLFVYLISVKLNDIHGMYIAFIQNFMMSWLFISMLNKRNSLAGQSLSIAILKMIGTLAPTIQFAQKSPFVMFLGIGCFIADCIYIAMVAAHKPAAKVANAQALSRESVVKVQL